METDCPRGLRSGGNAVSVVYGIVNRARCQLFGESRSEKGVIEAWRDAAFRLADQLQGTGISSDGGIAPVGLKGAEDDRVSRQIFARH